MSTKKKLLEAAAGNAGGGATYVDDVFSTFLYEGTGADQDIVNGVDLDGEGGMVWTKARTSGWQHALFDTERGANKRLGSNTTQQETTWTDTLTSFNSDGFSLGADSTYYVNKSGDNYVSWTFRKAPGFFDIVTWSGDQSIKNRAIPHNLGSTPGMVIMKSIAPYGRSWAVWHRSMTPHWTGGTTPNDVTGGNNVATLLLESTNAKSDQGYFTYVNDTAFGIDGFQADYNANGETYVAYVFAHDAQEFGTDEDESIIKCGSYTGNSGNQTIDVGFETQWVLIKNATSASTDWFVVDTMRGMVDTSAIDASLIRANESEAEQTSGAGGARITTRSTGFGFISESNLSCNSSGETYIYVAIRRPHKPASEFAATDLFALAGNTNPSNPAFVSGFPVDMALSDGPSMGWDKDIAARLTGTKRQETNKTSAEGNQPAYKWDYMDGYMSGSNGSTYGWQWRRAPGFFDVVCYTGTGSFVWLNHNLGVVPEMVWFKGRNYASNWNVFTTQGGTSSHLRLNDTDGNRTTGQNSLWTNLPTATQFRVGSDNEINGSGYDYVAYFFASVPGISKAGSYTGTAADLNVDCGFSAGARFILIKRTDSAGDWYVWDSARGIVSGNDPYILLNSNAAEVTNTDYVDPLASGFTVTSSAPAALNASGGTYLFYAIA